MKGAIVAAIAAMAQPITPLFTMPRPPKSKHGQLYRRNFNRGGRSRYQPHQGDQECARRVKQGYLNYTL